MKYDYALKKNNKAKINKDNLVKRINQNPKAVQMMNK